MLILLKKVNNNAVVETSRDLIPGTIRCCQRHISRLVVLVRLRDTY